LQFNGVGSSSENILKHLEFHSGGHGAEEFLSFPPQWGSEANRHDASGILGRLGILNVDRQVIPHCLKPGAIASILTDTGRICGSHDPAGRIHNSYPDISGIGSLDQSQVCSHRLRITSLEHRRFGQDLDIAVPFEENPVQFVGNVHRRQGESFPRTSDEIGLDIVKNNGSDY
jgi:hypothetical protein